MGIIGFGVMGVELEKWGRECPVQVLYGVPFYEAIPIVSRLDYARSSSFWYVFASSVVGMSLPINATMFVNSLRFELLA